MERVETCGGMRGSDGKRKCGRKWAGIQWREYSIKGLSAYKHVLHKDPH